MKRLFISLTAALILFSSQAETFTAVENITVTEPEFLNSYAHVTSSSTSATLPKELGEFKEHETKLGKFARIGSAVASIGMAVTGATLGLGGSLGTAVSALKTAGTVASVSSAAGTLDALTGFVGMDIVFKGQSSSYTTDANKDMQILFRNDSNEIDPQDIIRVVKFNVNKKERRIQWKNFTTSMLGTEDATKNGYLSFSAKKYGDSSYLITIPAAQLEKGEYGIIVSSAGVSTIIPIATFSIK